MTDEVIRPRRTTSAFWSNFMADIRSLHDFAEMLSEHRATCAQPAEDWLLDHIAFLETQAQVVKRERVTKQFVQIPHLRASSIPRVFALCDDYLEHVNGQYDAKTLLLYLQSYQQAAILHVRECAILPTVMRIAILSRLADAMREVRHRHEVCLESERMLQTIGGKGITEAQVRREIYRRIGGRALTSIELVHLVQHLREWEPDIRVVREWLHGHIDHSESSLEALVSLEHQLQSELQVRCGNLVRSLHRLEREPWRPIFTQICHVEQLLQTDELDEYPKLDESSQDVVRDAIARVAQRLGVPETLVAESAVELARRELRTWSGEGVPPRSASVPYYALDPAGLRTLHREIRRSTAPAPLRGTFARRRPSLVYFASGSLVLVVGMILTLAWAIGGFAVSAWGVVGALAALAFPVSEWVCTVLHDAITRFVKPVPLLRYDFSRGLPDAAKTMVVLPVIWSTEDEVDEAMNRLLVHYLANREHNIGFAILADFVDGEEAVTEADRALLQRAIDRIKALQDEYGPDKFYLFHRERRFNPVDQVYMGWERKRGKLVEFVELLRGKTDTSFTVCVGDLDWLRDVHYVFTADLDTRLPFGVVARLAGTMHLPYNRPRLNREGSRVIEGYGVLQPTLSVTYESTEKSRFASLWAGDLGIDPYAFAVSNPYQDLFGQAVFVGKGIFDVDAFASTLVDRIPENHVLSHDILEGGFLRAGLVADVEVVEEQPTTVYAYQRRAHRWIRGDWQLLQWIGRACRDRRGQRRPVDLCGVVRWHIVDHVRRSLLPPALLVVVWLGALHVLPGRTAVWSWIVLLTMFAPFIQTCAGGVLERDIDVRRAATVFAQNLIQLLLLPFTAAIAVDAAIRTLYRMLVSRRRLLEWVPSAQMERFSGSTTVMYGPLGVVVLLAIAVSTWAVGGAASIIVGSCAFVVCVIVFPVIRWLNRAPSPETDTWVEAHQSVLADWVRDIWAFYERYVTAEESWIPPDNVQYEPKETIAHRTSPTNIGLYLLSVLAARDVGLIDTRAMIDRIERTIDTVDHLEKWHGHLLNWYDTTNAQPLSPKYVSTVDSGNFVACLMVAAQGLKEYRDAAEAEQAERMTALADRLRQLIRNTDFRPLYNGNERLFSLGYHVDRDEKESILYDLMASEARQVSFVAIALGQVPVSHWFALSRTMTRAEGRKTLLSWSGTMFEYLMPRLLMRTYANSLWDETYQGVVAKQQVYAAERGVPFGVSESGYYAFDYQLNYQYRAFGVPGLGLDRGLDRHLVVAPYATILAMPIAKDASLTALRQFEQLGAKGMFGYYEAVDFTVDRLPQGHRHEVIRSFMAHHQGMSLLTLVNLLKNDVMVRRFHALPEVQAAEFLLQEKIPRKAAMIEEPAGSQLKGAELGEGRADDERRVSQYKWPLEVNVLSNGRMASVSTSRGDGFLSWKGIHVTRWHDDALANLSGTVLYLHDVASETTWSPTAFPLGRGDDGDARFRADKSTYQCTVDGIESTLEITVAPDVDVEVRRLELINRSNSPRTIEVTSFQELALADPAADRSHPAFSRLFVETSHDAESGCLLAKRRPREADEAETWAVHTLFVEGQPVTGAYEFETERPVFIGRGRSLKHPRALTHNLQGKLGSVADPAFVMRRRVQIPVNQRVVVYLLTGVANTREDALHMVQTLQEPRAVSHVFHLAWIRSQIELRYAHLSPRQSMDAQSLAARLLFPAALSERRKHAIEQNVLGQSSLWPHGLSGDAPIVTVRLAFHADLPFVVAVARLHHYLCSRGLAIGLAILDETVGGYQDQVAAELRDRLAATGLGDMNRIVVLKADRLRDAERTLLEAVSRIWIEAGGPSVRTQLQTASPSGEQSPSVGRSSTAGSAGSSAGGRTPELRSARSASPRPDSQTADDREFANGVGGFVDGGRAYEMDVTMDAAGVPSNKPWSNVLANPHFGTLITELGTGYTWWGNSREFKLTPWHNDPVLDPPAECFYIHDLDTDTLTSAAPKPAGEGLTYRVTHTFGKTRFQSSDAVLERTMEVVVPPEAPIKLIRLRLRNRTHQTRRVAVTYYLDWVLGVSRENQSSFIVTDWDDDSESLIAHNTYQTTFRDAFGFLHMATDAVADDELRSWTADRQEFIGVPTGNASEVASFARPAGLRQAALSKRTGTVIDACGAIRQVVGVPAGGEANVMVLVGCAPSADEIRALVREYGSVAAYEEAARATSTFWRETLGQVQVRTPDRAMDILLNGWLLYQALACRLWARTAFYQAGGAFGFRDQLQDSLALLHAKPDIARAQIIRNSAHQYREGDVQHWWHEETGKGIRTKFSDDLLWLPYAVSRYVEHTGDLTVLDERVPFLTSEVLREDELERYEDTVVSDEMGTVLDHAIRAIRHALRFGEHGLPLMGIGDWNDGMSRVGAKGRGESVWLAWFLLDVLKRFTRLPKNVLAQDVRDQLQAHVERLKRAANDNAWDGVWFRRAFTDAGQWLGSIANGECRIDAIAQSWSVISDGTSRERQLRAMKSFDKELVDPALGVARLLTPAFQDTQPSPGYIQGYPAGIRENGGQYTHGVIWGIVAWALLRQSDKAHKLFSMLNPIHHTRSPHEIAIYGNEPYVMSADIYTADPNRGQAGWSWYTGAAGWMYQAGLEYVLGVTRRADRLHIRPCVPADWTTFHVMYRYGSAIYSIEVDCSAEDADEAPTWVIDGARQTSPYLQLVDDGKTHNVSVQVGRDATLEVVG